MLIGLLAIPVIRLIQKTFAQTPTTYTITMTADGWWTVTPGTVTVNEWSNQTFTITPDVGHGIYQLNIDGAYEPVATEYTFYNITSDHTIEVNFATFPAYQSYLFLCPNRDWGGAKFTLIFDSNVLAIVPRDFSIVGRNNITKGTTYPATANGTTHVGLQMSLSWLDGTWSIEIPAGTRRNNMYDANPQSIPFDIDCKANVINITVGANGMTDPDQGAVTLAQQGDNQTINFIPDDWYEVDEVIANGVSIIPASTSYTFTNVREQQTLSVTFKEKTVAPTGWARTSDKCCLGNSTPGANKECKDYSPSVYDKTCLSVDTQNCEKDINACLWLTQKAALLRDLNDSFIARLQRLFWLPTLKTTSTTKIPEDTNIIPFLQRMADQLKALNDTFIKNIWTTTTQKAAAKTTTSVTQKETIPPTEDATLLLNALKNMAAGFQSLDSTITEGKANTVWTWTNFKPGKALKDTVQ